MGEGGLLSIWSERAHKLAFMFINMVSEALSIISRVSTWCLRYFKEKLIAPNIILRSIFIINTFPLSYIFYYTKL